MSHPASPARTRPHRRYGARTLAGAIVWVLGWAAPPISPAAADDFFDFRIPQNRSLLWTAGLTAQAAGQDHSTPGSEGSSGSSDAVAGTKFSWLSDSDPALTRLDVGFSARGFRLHDDSEVQSFTPPSGSLSVNERSDRRMFENWTLAASHRKYPWAVPLGIEASASATGSYSQRWASLDSDGLIVNPGLTFQNTQANHSETWTYANVFAASAATGWGRVRNATGIYDALVLEQRLRETGALARPLSRQGRQRLAEVLYLRGTLDTVRERPGRVLWREIERVLADDGALREGGLDPYSVLRAAEPHLGESGPLTVDGVPISPVARAAGTFVGLRVQDFNVNTLQRDEFRSSFETIQNGVVIGSGSSSGSGRLSNSFDSVEGGAAGEYHRPMGPDWQLDAFGFVMLGLRKQDNSLTTDAGLSLAWLAADRWTATASAAYRQLDDDRTEGATPSDRWQWNASLGVRWYIEDRTAIELSASQSQAWERGDPAAGSHFFERGLGASLGVTYRFAGWFATPGFFPAPMALPPVPQAQP